MTELARQKASCCLMRAKLASDEPDKPDTCQSMPPPCLIWCHHHRHPSLYHCCTACGRCLAVAVVPGRATKPTHSSITHPPTSTHTWAHSCTKVRPSLTSSIHAHACMQMGFVWLLINAVSAVAIVFVNKFVMTGVHLGEGGWGTYRVCVCVCGDGGVCDIALRSHYAHSSSHAVTATIQCYITTACIACMALLPYSVISPMYAHMVRHTQCL